MKLPIHSQTSTMESLKFENGYVISSHTLLGLWFLSILVKWVSRKIMSLWHVHIWIYIINVIADQIEGKCDQHDEISYKFPNVGVAGSMIVVSVSAVICRVMCQRSDIPYYVCFWQFVCTVKSLIQDAPNPYVLSRIWRCSRSNADRRYSNYIWVIKNLSAY